MSTICSKRYYQPSIYLPSSVISPVTGVVMRTNTPQIMPLNLNKDNYVTKLVPIDSDVKNWKQINSYKKENPLPKYLDLCISYSPFGFLITTNGNIDSIKGWRVIFSEKWNEVEKKHKANLLKNAINMHIKNREGVIKIGNSWSYHREEISDEKNSSSVIHHCLSAWYVEIGNIDGIAYDFVRKVRSSSSIQDELNMGIFPYGENLQTSDVMVTIDSGQNEFRSGILGNICENENLNMRFEGSLDTVREYDEKNGFSYTDKEAEETCIVYVRHNKKQFPYAANRVYRVLRIEDWRGKLRNSMNNLLRLSPKEYFSHIKKGLKILRGIRFSGLTLKLTFPENVNWEVKTADVSSDCVLADSSLSSKFLFNGSWKHQIGKHLIEPLPSINVTYCVNEDDLWALSELKKYNDSVFSIVPSWNHHTSGQTIVIKGESETEISQSILEGINHLKHIEGEHLVVSGLRPSRPNLNTYTLLKRRLTELDIKHQNYQISSPKTMKAPQSRSTYEMNICQLLLKFGRLPVPFKIEIGDIDMVVGVDIGRSGKNRSRPAMAVSIDRYGNMYGGSVSAEPQPGEEMSNRTIRDLIEKQITRYADLVGKRPSRIVILRDGNSSIQELDDMDSICNEWLKLGVDIAWITLQKSGSPRLLVYIDEEVIDELPNAQSYLIADESSAWCWTTGGKVGSFPGIPRGFSFRVERNYESRPLDMDQWCRTLIAQSRTSQVNPYANTRLPFTLHLADKMAKALIRGTIPPDYSGNGFPAC